MQLIYQSAMAEPGVPEVPPLLFCKSFKAPKTEVRRLFSKFFTANILFWEYLGVVCFRPKNQCFLQEKDPATLSHEQGAHSAKTVPIVWLEIAKMPPKISAQFVCPSPKVSNF